MIVLRKSANGQGPDLAGPGPRLEGGSPPLVAISAVGFCDVLWRLRVSPGVLVSRGWGLGVFASVSEKPGLPLGCAFCSRMEITECLFENVKPPDVREDLVTPEWIRREVRMDQDTGRAQTPPYVDIHGRVSGKSVPDVRVLNRFEW
jgi:hypothetical protein